MYTILFKGKWLSINAAYSKHYHQRNKVKKEYQATFTQLLTEAQIKPLSAFRIHLRYNSRMDLDNTVAGLKVMVDTMREMKLAENDTKTIYKGLTVEPDLSLKHNMYIVSIIPE